jgi:hypothetical protein
VRVCGKSRREVRLPLPQDAGDAVLEYLEHARPHAASERLFLCVPKLSRSEKFTDFGMLHPLILGALGLALAAQFNLISRQ